MKLTRRQHALARRRLVQKSSAAFEGATQPANRMATCPGGKYIAVNADIDAVFVRKRRQVLARAAATAGSVAGAGYWRQSIAGAAAGAGYWRQPVAGAAADYWPFGYFAPCELRQRR